MPEDPVIVSPDTARPERLPPGQSRTVKWPVLHAGPTPVYRDLSLWDFTVPAELCDRAVRLSWAEFGGLPRAKVFADMHCVTQWSMLDNLWTGVPTRALLALTTPAPEARFVLVRCEYGFTTNLPIDDFFAEDALLATHHNGDPLDAEHGFPLRLVIPRLYAWKSAKWVRGVTFMADDRPGFWERWENGGYHMRGDPWAEERFQGDRQE